MANHFDLKNYDHKHRWTSYWYQAREVFKLNPPNVLEIGKGNGFLYDYLKKAGIQVTSLDIDPERKPDITANVLEIPLEDNSFGAVLCFQVLEHLPFEDFPKALKEMRRVSQKYVVISLPHWGWTFYLILKFPLIKELKILFKISGLVKHGYDGEHYWEIGRRDYSLGKIKSLIKNCGFKILKDYINPDSPFHHFFVLEKTDERL
jgi:ubiquinone/menaquinone biosynthesis C-methylase UbiE